MKRILSFLTLIPAAIQFGFGQCSQCTPVDCSALKPAGGLCNYLHDDTAGKPYEEVISFYMPNTLTDPNTLSQCGGCSSVTLRRIRVVGIQGLPPGLTYTVSNNGVYDVSAGEQFGCVHFCGTPVAPGTYYMVVNLLADVTANGTPIGNVNANDQAQQYRDTMIIYPGVSDCPTSFSLGGGPCVTKSCDSVSVNLNATLTNTNCPSLISYDWSFGNGSTSHSKTPGAINYTTPDTFPLTLVTTYYTYRIKSVAVNVTGGYSGDVEELTSLSNPDPYIRINSLAFNNRGSSSDVKSVTFNNLNLVIPELDCASQVEIQVWDEDTGPPQGTNPLGSQDDHIDDHLITPSVPNQVVSMKSNSSVAVTFDTVATSSITETIDIVVYPHPPVPVVTTTTDSTCNGDSLMVSFTPIMEGYMIHWYLNDTTELASTDSIIYAKAEGDYKVKITNMETGCEETSLPRHLAFGQRAPASVNIIYNGTQLFVTPFPASGFAVDWYYNGNLVAGQNGKFLPYLGNGVYVAEVYNADFPFCRTVSNPDSLTVSGIETIADNPVKDLTIYPNPNTGRFTMEFTSDNYADVKITISNTIGQVVYEQNLTDFEGNFKQDIDLSNWSKGVYIAMVKAQGGTVNKRVIVQ